jgi:hypothetical protein
VFFLGKLFLTNLRIFWNKFLQNMNRICQNRDNLCTKSSFFIFDWAWREKFKFPQPFSKLDNFIELRIFFTPMEQSSLLKE